MDTRPTRRRSASVTLGITAILVAMLSGCSASQEREEYGYQEECDYQEDEEGNVVSRGGFGSDCDDSVGG